MPISFECGQCGKTIQVKSSMAGRRAKCPQCQADVQAPGIAETPGSSSSGADGKVDLDSAFDWSLVEDTLKAPTQPTPAKKQGVDWDVLAGKAPPPLPEEDDADHQPGPPPPNPHLPGMAGTPTRMASRERRRSSERRQSSGKPKRVEQAYLNDALRSIPTSVGYLPAVMLLLVGSFIGLFMLSLISGGMARWLSTIESQATHDRIAWIWIVTVFLILLCMQGYLLLYFMQVTADAADGYEGFTMPPLDPGAMIWAVVLVLLFDLVYILPLVTLPLAPVAFLTLARTRSLRAFDIVWVARITFSHFAQVLVLMATMFIGVIAFYLTLWALQTPLGNMIAVLAENAEPPHDKQIAALVVVATLLPIVLTFAAMFCRMIGVLGKHHPQIEQETPQRVNWAVVGPTIPALPLLAYFLILPTVGIATAPSVARLARSFTPPRRTTSPRDNRDVTHRDDGPGANDRDGRNRRGSSNGTPHRTVVVTPAREQPNLTGLSEAEQFTALLDEVYRPDDLHRAWALARLKQFDANDDDRQRVIDAMSHVMIKDQRNEFTPAAVDILKTWIAPVDVVLITASKAQDENVRAATLRSLAAMKPDEARRREVVLALELLLRDERSLGVAVAAVGAYTAWSEQPAAGLIGLLEDDVPGVAAVIIGVKAEASAEAAQAVADYMLERGDRNGAADALIAMGAVAEAPARALLESTSPVTLLAGLQVLDVVGTAESVPAVRTLAGHRLAPVAAKAKALWQKLAPDDYTPLNQALVELDQFLTTSRPVSSRDLRDVLAVIAAAEPTDDARPRVTQRLIDLLVGSNHLLSGAVRFAEDELDSALARWSDQSLVQELIQRLKGLADRDHDQRRRLLAALGKTGSDAAVVVIADFLGKDNAAHDALIDLGITAELHLLRILRTSEDNTLKRKVIDILHEIGGQRSLSPLIALGRIPSHPLARPAAKAVLAIQKRLQSQ